MDRTLSYCPAFTFFNTLIYYIYTLATPDGTVLSRQEKRRENPVARTPYVLKLVSAQPIGASVKPVSSRPHKTRDFIDVSIKELTYGYTIIRKSAGALTRAPF